MSASAAYPTESFVFDPERDLLFERLVAASREQLWGAWTTPDLLMRWFTPAPWKTIQCQIDLCPGGLFRTLMRSPEGETVENIGCYLEVQKPGRLVWTNALLPGYRPVATRALSGPVDFAFTAVLSFTAFGGATRYGAHLLHADAATCRQHRDMGFHEGWGQALDQLLEVLPAT